MQHRRGGGRDRRPYGDRPDRGARDDRGGFGAPRDERGGFAGPRDDRGGYGRREERGGFGAPPRRDRFPARGDDGGMSLRLDPRRLGTLKQIAAEQGLRPGELVTRWVEERIDSERGGGRAAVPSPKPDVVAELTARLDALTRRVDALAGGEGAAQPAIEPESTQPAPPQQRSGSAETAEPVETPEAELPEAEAAPARRARRPRAEGNGRGPKIALHDEIIAVISERGPMSAADLASAITERGRYTAPRSGKPLDAATVSARVSNPVYRSRFRRENGRIALAE
jgi:hypothetical protein